MSEESDRDTPDQDEEMFLREAWLQAQMAKTDKMVSLSAGAIGLLITLISALGFNSFQVPFYVLATLTFTIALACQLYILHRNPQKIEDVFEGKREQDESMLHAERAGLVAFGIGVICALFIAFSYTANPTPKAKQIMGSDKSNSSKQSTKSDGDSRSSKERKNLSNIGNLGSSGSSDSSSQQSSSSSQQDTSSSGSSSSDSSGGSSESSESDSSND
jgi:hypothetical protein